MSVSKQEILRIAKLASLKLEEDKIDMYIENLEQILNFADIVNKAPIEGLEESIRTNDDYNIFRKDEIDCHGDRQVLLQNAPEQEEGMFKIPKVIN